MARRRYIAWNQAMPTTGNFTPVTTGTALKTMLQIKPTTNIAIIEWGYSFATVPSVAVEVGLMTSGIVAATVTAHAASGVMAYDDAAAPASAVSLGTSATGFTASAEGTITTARVLDFAEQWAQSYSKQFPLDREPGVQANDILRIRMNTTVAHSAVCYVIWEE
jgi:hypothetical protein